MVHSLVHSGLIVPDFRYVRGCEVKRPDQRFALKIKEKHWSGKRDSNPRPSAWEAMSVAVHCVYWGHYVGYRNVMHTIHKLTDNQNDNLGWHMRLLVGAVEML